MHNIKIKDNDSCDYCGGVDDILHFFKKCPKVRVNDFWSYWINWWENLFEIAIKNSPVLEECIIFGCPLNFRILYAKYYIYLQRLFNKNELDLYACLAQVKLALEIEYNICKNSNKEKDSNILICI